MGWTEVLEECSAEKDSAHCVLSRMLELERTSSEHPQPAPEMLFNVLDVLLNAPPVGAENAVVDLTERLVHKLQISNTITGPFKFNNTEVGVMTVGPNTPLTGSQLKTEAVLLDIDLLGIAKNNNGSASVVIISTNKMHLIFNNSYFKAESAEVTFMNSKVVSVILPQTVNKTLCKPVNLTFQHLNVSDPNDEPVCVYWNMGQWAVDGCNASKSNSTRTVCTCDHLSTFALIMKANPARETFTESNSVIEKLSTFFQLVGLVFLTLAVLTFALCRHNPRVTNIARLNLSVCLLLAHSLFLITQANLDRIQPHKVLCSVMAGLLHFLFLCCFMWMSAEAVLLFLSVRKLRQIKAKTHTGPHWRYKLLVGYGIPLFIVSVSAIAAPDGYGSQDCWLKAEEGFIWSFLGPVVLILIGNILFFIVIFVTIYITLRKAQSEASKVQYTRILLFKITAQFVILGCPWMFLTASGNEALELLFLFLTSQQGTAIFFIYCLLNSEVRKQYYVWWQKYDPSRKLSSTSPSDLRTQHTSLAPDQHPESIPAMESLQVQHHAKTVSWETGEVGVGGVLEIAAIPDKES